MSEADSPIEVLVLGAGFAGLSAACYLAKAGKQVLVLEKHDMPGGRARTFKAQGFTFDMGPSWYWMPEVMESVFKDCGADIYDFLTLERLDPSYQVIFSNHELMALSADYNTLKQSFEAIEAGSGAQLDAFLQEAEIKYRLGMGEFVYKPALSWLEFFKISVLRAAPQLQLLRAFSKHVRQYFKDPRLIQILEFPVLFLGATAQRIPALYSLMNFADIKLGTWYPKGGFGELAQALYRLALSLGVKFEFNCEVNGVETQHHTIKALKSTKGNFYAAQVLATCDYHFFEQELLAAEHRQYDKAYWESRSMAPSCLLYYVGLDVKVPRLIHHNLFFDTDFEQHALEIYTQAQWPTEPLSYICCPSKTDSTIAPEGSENLFMLIPVAPGLEDSPEIRNRYFNLLIDKLEKFCNIDLRSHVRFMQSYAGTDFKQDYHAFKGNAYGLANTLMQTAVLKPRIRSKKLQNLFYAGQLTVPGPGVPPALISGKVAATQILEL